MKNTINNNISVLFVPFDLIKNKNYESLDYKNSFKILVNENNDVEEIKQFFFKSVLEDNHYYEDDLQKKINIKLIFEGNTNDNNGINNYTIFAYLDPQNMIKAKNKINAFFLINEYNLLHEKKNKFNKIPNYINIMEDIKDLNIKCPETNKIIQNSFPQLIDERDLISYFLDNNYYYNKFPLIYINSQYYEGFFKYLENNKKYQIYKEIDGFKKIFISSEKKINFSHSENQNIIAEVVENKNFYSFEDISNIINSIKESIKGNYISIINNYIITIFELLSECLLFILKLKACYCICPDCKKPILFIDNNEENKNKIMNQNIKEEKDITLKKSIKVCNNIFKCLISSFDKSKYINYKNLYFKNNNKNIFIPSCPPKKKKFINVIYHNKNYQEFSSSINKDARDFKKVTNGTFIFSNSMESFETIMNGINKDLNNKNKQFLLITTGSTFLVIHQFLKDKNFLDNISDIVIYCLYKSKYEYLLQNPDYPKLKAIFTTQEEVKHFIEENSSEKIEIFQLIKLVSYQDYIHNYYKLHNIIAEYYKNSKEKKSYDIAIGLVKQLLNETGTEENSVLLEGLRTFETNRDYEVISEYTSNRIYKQLNGWLLSLKTEAYEKIAYFIGILMYKLNDYGIENKKMNKNNFTLYRGMCISYLDALSYQIYKKKIICFQNFFSTSKDKDIAEGFASYFDTEEEKRKNYQFSVIIIIKNNYKEDLYPLCFDISEKSCFTKEEEFLFQPFTFFRIKDIDIDYENFKIELNLEAINKKEILENKMNEDNIIKYNKEKNLIEINNKNKEEMDEEESQEKSESDKEKEEENDEEKKDESDKEKESDEEKKDESDKENKSNEEKEIENESNEEKEKVYESNDENEKNYESDDDDENIEIESDEE